MIEYILLVLLGVVAGVFTGLIPGIHPNTVIFTSMPAYFAFDLALLNYMSFIAGLSVSHTFHDFLPAIFIGAPEAEAALSALPGARMVLMGRGEEAFLYTVFGGLFSVLTLIVLLPLIYFGLPMVYSTLRPVMGFILMFFLFFIIFRSDESAAAASVSIAAGLLGLVVFEAPVNQQFVLMPVFSGLFAFPAIVHALRTDIDIPEQERCWPDTGNAAKGGAMGFVAGLVAGVFPGIGAATSTSFLAPLLNSEREFLASMGGVNTSDILVSFVSLYLIGQARSGSAVALSALARVDLSGVVFLAGASLLAVGVSVAVAVNISPYFMAFMKKVDFRKVIGVIPVLIVALTFFLTGFVGLLILFTASFTGYAALIRSQRPALMAVLIVPAVVFYTPVLFG